MVRNRQKHSHNCNVVSLIVILLRPEDGVYSTEIEMYRTRDHNMSQPGLVSVRYVVLQTVEGFAQIIRSLIGWRKVHARKNILRT